MPRPETCAAEVCSNPGPRHNNKFVQCYGGCDRSFHWKCIGLTAAASTALKDIRGLYWFCDDCKNNSTFRLHHKVDYINGSVEAIRILLRRVETNLESKLETCYNMIQSLASIQSVSNASFNAQHCCSHRPTIAALDLSVHAGDNNAPPPAPSADTNGKRKLGEVGNDDEIDGDCDNEDADAVSEGPTKRFRNLHHNPAVNDDDLADLPTPTYASDDPVVAHLTDSTGNYTSSICPAEVGHDTAPSMNPFVSSAYTVYSNEAGEAVRRSPLQPPQPLQPTYAQNVSSVDSDPLMDEPAMDTSHPSHPVPSSGPPVIAAQHDLTGNHDFSMCPAEVGLDTAPPQEFPQISSAMIQPATHDMEFLAEAAPNSIREVSTNPVNGATQNFPAPNPTNSTAVTEVSVPPSMVPPPITCLPNHPTAPTLMQSTPLLPGCYGQQFTPSPQAPFTFLPGNARTSICPAGASGIAAPSFGPQTVPETTAICTTAYTQCSPSLPVCVRQQPAPPPPAPLTYLSATATIGPPIVEHRLRSLPGGAVQHQAALPQQVSSAFRPGNAQAGICLAGATGTAAPSSGPQLIPATSTSRAAPPRPLLPPATVTRFNWPGQLSTNHQASASQIYWPGQYQILPQTSLAFQPGNTRVGICSTEASGTAAPSNSFQPVPVYRFGSSDVLNSRRSGKLNRNSQPVTQYQSPARLPQETVIFQSAQSNHTKRNLPAAGWPLPSAATYNNNMQQFGTYTMESPAPLPNSTRSRNRKQQANSYQPLTPQPSVTLYAPQLPAPTPTLAPPANAFASASKHFYVKPFDPATSADQIALYIQSKTGWGREYFSCQRLTSESRSDSRPLTFVSFKVTVPDNPTFTSVIANPDLWPDFVAVDSFTTRRRS